MGKADGTPSLPTYGIHGSIPVEENALFSEGFSTDSNLHTKDTGLSQHSNISDTDTSYPLTIDFDISQPDGGDTKEDDKGWYESVQVHPHGNQIYKKTNPVTGGGKPRKKYNPISPATSLSSRESIRTPISRFT